MRKISATNYEIKNAKIGFKQTDIYPICEFCRICYANHGTVFIHIIASCGTVDFTVLICLSQLSETFIINLRHYVISLPEAIWSARSKKYPEKRFFYQQGIQACPFRGIQVVESALIELNKKIFGTASNETQIYKFYEDLLEAMN